MRKILTFGEAFVKALKGKKIKRLGWKRENVYFRIGNAELTDIQTSKKNCFFTTINSDSVSNGAFCIMEQDMLANDWVVVE